jgi:hypothetical protein
LMEHDCDDVLLRNLRLSETLTRKARLTGDPTRLSTTRDSPLAGGSCKHCTFYEPKQSSGQDA